MQKDKFKVMRMVPLNCIFLVLFFSVEIFDCIWWNRFLSPVLKVAWNFKIFFCVYVNNLKKYDNPVKTKEKFTYFYLQLLISKKASIQKLLETHVFYITPVFNPDGYEYTFTDDRLWRKTRRPTNKKGCIGTDVNRNWNFKWGRKFDIAT